MTPVGVTCTACGTALRDSARFCDACGTRLPASVQPAEYKQVTVLFADVVRSMDIAAALDPERLRTVMTEVVERLAAIARRYSGTVEYTGDGVMALFGAPIALEDHAFQACMAALDIQREADRMSEEVAHRDAVALQLRVGLNSGQVIAGDIGSGSLGYVATGEHVGMAQRMESVAPPGGVMLSESTARLVEHLVSLADPEQVHIKGFDEPVYARRLMAIGPRDVPPARAETSLVGRGSEMATLHAAMDRADDGRGGVVNVIGPPGIGKSRVAREAAAAARTRQVPVFWTFCEAHARDAPFGAVARLMRAATGVAGLSADAARARVREHTPDADPQDLLLLDDLLGIADPDLPPPQVDSDARRRRLTTLISSMALAHSEPAMFVVEDAHWIDGASESQLAELLTVIPHTRAMVLVTARPEYDGTLRTMPDAQTISLAPLADSDAAALLSELLGPDPSVGALSAIIADRAAGNPFFAEEMVRELAQRGVLTGERGRYICRAEVDELKVPATVQATIEARIDRLTAPAKRTLSAASVIGARFDAALLADIGVDPVLDELLAVDLIDQVEFGPRSEYAFHHPLIHAVAYESQLRSDRAQWHGRLAAAMQERMPDSVEENAALIAEHLEAAGELAAAYGWRMRAAAWSATRDVDAARVSWQRAKRIADMLAADGSDQLSLRIPPLTMLCATAWQARAVHESQGHFIELRDLCEAADDKVSLAIGMTGLATELLYAGRPGEGSRLASEQMALLDSIGDPNLTAGLAFVAFANWFNSGDFGEILRWSQTVIDLAAGDPTVGAGFGLDSPVAVATAFRSVARWWLGHPGWREDIDAAIAMSRDSDRTTRALVVSWTYGLGTVHGVLRADDSAMRAIEDAAQTAARAANDLGLSGTRFALGTALMCRDSKAERHRGLEILTEIHHTWLPERTPSLVPVVELVIGRERVRQGHTDALPSMRSALDDLYRQERLGWCVFGTAYFVEALLECGSADDVAEAAERIESLAELPDTASGAIQAVTVLRLRALLARARDDEDAYRESVSHYRAMANALGFQGHIALAAALD